jgi:hypothetical protein
MPPDPALKFLGQALQIAGGKEIWHKIADAERRGRFREEKVSQPIHALERTGNRAWQSSTAPGGDANAEGIPLHLAGRASGRLWKSQRFEDRLG